MNISLESIPAMSASEKAAALALLQKSLVAKTPDGLKMLALLGSPEHVLTAADGQEVVVTPGPDGLFGTVDDVVRVIPPPPRRR